MGVMSALKKGFQHVDEVMAVKDLGEMFWKQGGKEAVTKAGAQALKKWGREAQIEAVVLARLATRSETWEPSDTESVEGLGRLNAYYATLDAVGRHRFEKVVYSGVWSALSDGFGGEGLQAYRKITEKVQKGMKTTTKIPGGGTAGKYAKFLILLGLAGEAEIELELDRLERASRGELIRRPFKNINESLDTILRNRNNELAQELATRRAARRVS